jgi:hypothetical protein
MIGAGCAAGLATEDALAAMKEGELAAAAQHALTCGWLPPELRDPAYALAAPEAGRACLAGRPRRGPPGVSRAGLGEGRRARP